MCGRSLRTANQSPPRPDPVDVTVTVKSADGSTKKLLIPITVTAPVTGPVWGVYNGLGAPYDTGDDEYTALIGSRPRVGISYYSMADGQLPNAQESRRVAAGTVPQISCESKSYKTATLQWAWVDIATGKYDAQYILFAQKLAALNGPVMVCPDHEGDEQITNKQRLNPADTGAAYAKAWLHVQSVMAPIAPKIIWVWWMGGYNTANMRSCYVGDSHVDVVGCDPYRSKSHPASETAAQTWNSRLSALDTFVGASVPRAMTETATDITSAGIPAAVAWWDGVADRATALGLTHVNFYNRHSDGEWWANPYPDVQAAIKRQIAKMNGPFKLL